MANDENRTSAQLTKDCQEAFKKYPKSCSHAVWHVIKQYKSDQKWMNANDLVAHLRNSSNWKEVQLSELTKFANHGALVVGGATEDGHGHITGGSHAEIT